MSVPAEARRRAGLDHDEVVDTALALVESGGPDALTMRKLAAELGVAPTAIYWHVGSRDEVVLALVERLSHQQAAIAIEGDTPRDRVMAAARLVWDLALHHPRVASLAHQAGASSLLNLPLERAIARELTAAGIEGDPARDALRAILITVGGFLVMALRSPDLVPEQRTNTALWAGVDDPAIAPATIAALTRPVELHALFEDTVRAVIDHHVPA